MEVGTIVLLEICAVQESVHVHKSEVPECPLSRRCWGDTGRDGDIV
jgi:hypothetical protein